MNNKLLISVKNDINRFIKKCINNKIDIFDIHYYDDNYIICKINYNDYKKIKKINYYSDIKIIKYEGFKGLNNHIKKYFYVYLLLIFCFMIMDFITSFIVDIEVIHENMRIRSLVIDELKNHGIEKYHLAYSFSELEKIKKDILNDNPSQLEWMSITRVGMKYVVRVEERIIKDKEKEIKPRNIISSKDALITKVIVNKGESLVRSGEYVKKGSLLVSGNIYINDELKDRIAASGVVYGDVWYTVSLKIPKEKVVVYDTGKKRYNLNINNKILLKNKYPYFKQNNIKEFNILGFKIKIYEEIEYQEKIIKLNNDELDNEVYNKIIESFNNKLKGNGQIIKQKVLKKEENNSTIDYRVFITTNEIISSYEYLPEGDFNDTSKSN